MTVRFKPSKSSASLDKFLKSQKNLSKPPPRLWPDSKQQDFTAIADQRLSILTLNHSLLRTLASCNSIKHFNQVHAQLIVFNLIQHPLAASQAIKKLCDSLNAVSYAVSVFNCLQEPDAFLCNSIMRGFVNLNDPSGALSFYYGNMVGRWVAPNHYTFPILVKVGALIGSVREGEKAHGQVVKFGFESDLFVKNSLIHMYSVYGRIRDAREVFDKGSESDLVTWNSMIYAYVMCKEVDFARDLFDLMPERDVFSWNSMTAGYVAVGDMEAAKELFERMPFRDVVSWNCMIDGYARIGNILMAGEFFYQAPLRNVVSWNTMLALYVRCKDYGQCLRLFDRMIDGGEAEPDKATIVSVLTASANLGRLDRGKWVHSYIKNSGIETDVLLSTTLLTMYAKCGAMDLAKDVFDRMPEKSVVSWNSMIMGYGMHGYGETALEMFLEMEKRGPMPNSATFVCILSACVHAGMLLEGWWYFDMMDRVYKIKPKVEHYGCMVDLFARAGLMKDSEQLLQKVPMEAGSVSWGALLSACRTHSNSELGVIVAKRLIELEPEDIGSYVLLSNIYAAEGKWDEVENVRKMMKEKGLQKAAGSSLVHLAEFGSESLMENGSSHRRSMVYSMLSEVGAQIEVSCRDSNEKLEMS